MSSNAQEPWSRTACAACLRRSWLLAQLSPRLDYGCQDRARLTDTLALDDAELLRALAGRRREELTALYERFGPAEIPQREGVSAVCRHNRLYPTALRDARGPSVLHLTGGPARLAKLAREPVVAIVGSKRASDYGIEVAKSIARGLAACGVTVAGGIDDGIAAAAHAGALELGGAPIVVLPGGVDVGFPARRRSLLDRVRRRGSIVSELPCGSAPRRWGQPASERVISGLARLTIVVEAHDSTRELAGARLAQAQGRIVAAVPGRVTSPLASGPLHLLAHGAHLVRGAADALELLYGTDAPAPTATRARAAQAELEPRLSSILELVGGGMDSPERLAGAGVDAGAALLALSELELLGHLARGDGGRYVLRDPLAVE